MTDVRVRLDDDTVADIDHRRGDLSRSTYLRLLIERPEPTRPVLTGQMAEVLQVGVDRATQAFRDHRPGYGAYLLTRLAMDVQRMEVGR